METELIPEADLRELRLEAQSAQTIELVEAEIALQQMLDVVTAELQRRAAHGAV